MNIEENSKAIIEQVKQLTLLDRPNSFVSNLINRSLESTLTEIRAAQENAEFWNTLIDINQFSEGKDRRELLKRVAEKVRKLLNADIVVIYEGIKEGQFVSPRPGIAGELKFPQYMEDKIRESDVVFRILEREGPYYSSYSQEDETLIAGSPLREVDTPRFTIREQIRSTAAIPLKIEGETVGIIFVNYHTPQSFDDRQRSAIEAVAEHTAIAIHNLRLLRRQIQNRTDLTHMLEIIRESTSHVLNIEHMLQTVIKNLVELIRVPRGAIVLWGNEGGVVFAEHKTDETLLSMKGSKFFGNSEMEKKLSEGEMVQIENTAADPILSDEEKKRFQEANIQSTLIVPAVVGKRLFATIGVDETRGKRTFTQREVDLCKTLAAQVAIALELNEKTGYSQLRAIQQELLRNIFDKKTVFELILKRGLELIEATVGELLLREADELIIQASTVPEEIGTSYLIDDSIGGLVVQSREPLIISNIESSETYKKLYKFGADGPMKSELAVPLILDEEVIGVLNAENPKEGAFTQYHLNLWMILASQATLSIDVAQHLDEERAIAEIRKEIVDSRLKFNSLIQLILKRMCELIGARIGQLILLENDKLIIVASTEEEDKGLWIEPGSVTEYAIKNDRTINIRNLETDKEYRQKHKWYAKGKMLSELISPLKRGDKVIGALNVESQYENAFSKADERILEKFASEITVAIELSRQENMNYWVRKIQDSILGNPETFDLEAVYTEIIQSGIQLLNSQTGAILRRREEDILEVVASESEEGFSGVTRQIGTTYHLDNCISGFAVKNRQIVNVEDVVNQEPYKHLYQTIAEGILSNIVVPLEVQGNIIGALSFESISKNAFSATDEPFLTELAHQAGRAIERAELIEQSKVRESSIAEERLAVEVTHRLNNPLGAVRAWALEADELLKKRDYEKLRTTVTQIIENAEEAMNLVDDMRWKRREFFAKEIEVDPYLEKFLVDFRETNDIPLDIKIVPILNAKNISIRADEVLFRVFQNLFENSIRAMDSIGILEIGSKIDGDIVEIWVKDNGHGVPAKLIPVVFTEFFTTKPTGYQPGNGVGLWWCEQYVKAYRGTIRLDSDMQEKWTRVTIRFPIARPLEARRLVDALLS